MAYYYYYFVVCLVFLRSAFSRLPCVTYQVRDRTWVPGTRQSYFRANISHVPNKFASTFFLSDGLGIGLN